MPSRLPGGLPGRREFRQSPENAAKAAFITHFAILLSGLSLRCDHEPFAPMDPHEAARLGVGGDSLACEARWHDAEYQRADQEGLPGRSLTRIGEQGTLPVPDRVLATAPLPPPERLSLTVSLWNRSAALHLRASPEKKIAIPSGPALGRAGI